MKAAHIAPHQLTPCDGLLLPTQPRTHAANDDHGDATLLVPGQRLDAHGEEHLFHMLVRYIGHGVSTTSNTERTEPNANISIAASTVLSGNFSVLRFVCSSQGQHMATKQVSQRSRRRNLQRLTSPRRTRPEM